MIDAIDKILGIVSRVLWLVIGIVFLYAIVKVGTTGVEKIIGGAASGNVPTPYGNYNQQYPGQPPFSNQTPPPPPR